MKKTLLLLAWALPVLASDVRLQPLKDLDGYFPFSAPDSVAAWEARKAVVRRQVLVAEGLWPMPTKTPLNPVIHGKIDCGDYTVEKVYFESAPGFFVTGNLYRPKSIKGKAPGVLFAHGHWENARLSFAADDHVRQEIAAGAERFEKSGHSIFQALCVQLARMGCVVWQWDMLSDSDSVQFSREVVHGFKKQRPEMNATENWGLYSPQAEAHAQSVMGLQVWNAVRGLDFLLGLPEVDPERTAITGASGGGTQTMLLAAIDDRIKLSFPVVMVSTAMQGGCTCENASLLRVDTGNVEFAALFAPKPQGMNTADDWTKEMATKGFPDLQKIYALYGAADRALLVRGEHFPHNYNAVTRSAFYTFINKYFNLGQTAPVIERDFEPLTRDQLTVWDAQHPAPKAADPAFERALLTWFAQDAAQQLRACAATPEGWRDVVRPAAETLIGRTLASAGEVEGRPFARQDRGDYVETKATLVNKTYGEEVSAVWLCPKRGAERAVVWLGDAGQGSLRGADGNLVPAVAKLLQGGAAVLGADLLFQGAESVKQTRVVANPREAPAYTFGYNRALFAQRAHDVLTLVAFLRGVKPDETFVRPKSVLLAGWGSAGPVAAVAGALSGESVDRVAADTQGFRFGQVLDYRDPMFLPGGAKYFDLPGFLALNVPHALWLAGEAALPEPAAFTYRAAQAPVLFAGEAAQKELAAAEWLLK